MYIYNVTSRYSYKLTRYLRRRSVISMLCCKLAFSIAGVLIFTDKGAPLKWMSTWATIRRNCCFCWALCCVVDWFWWMQWLDDWQLIWYFWWWCHLLFFEHKKIVSYCMQILICRLKLRCEQLNLVVFDEIAIVNREFDFHWNHVGGKIMKWLFLLPFVFTWC